MDTDEQAQAQPPTAGGCAAVPWHQDGDVIGPVVPIPVERASQLPGHAKLLTAGEQAAVRSVHYYGRDGFSHAEFDRWVSRLPGRIVSVVWGGAVGFIAICEEPPSARGEGGEA